MTLDEALQILAESHTRDDDFSGFTVESTRDPLGRWTRYEYVEAWKAVRQHLHLQTEPKE